nr:MAG TPA: hypothetical protein [Caudoviricetes sp.]
MLLHYILCLLCIYILHLYNILTNIVFNNII